jgi:aspartate-semialdehyde dehydrogenase
VSAKSVVVVGATGLVGTTLLRVLEERRFPVARLRLGASGQADGRTAEFAGERLPIEAVDERLFDGAEVAFFAAGNDVSLRYAPVAVRSGAYAIDKSSAFRMDPAVPLVVPEVNGHLLPQAPAIVASPNCSTIQLVMVLEPLRRQAAIRRVAVSTYQAVSGTGREAVEELLEQSRGYLAGAEAAPKVYPRPIAFNVLPHCDAFEADGFTREETKLVRETRRILEEPDLPLVATAVRVPSLVGHGEAVEIAFASAVTPAEAREALADFPGVRVVDDPSALDYPTPRDAAGRDDVLVGRIRRDPTVPWGLVLFVVADNLRKGAALNAVQIAERLVAARPVAT